MYKMVQDFRRRTHKPVIASGQEVMASGAYYIACACDEIVAQPTSIVGSIGVIFNNFNVQQGLAKLGIYAEDYKSGPMKDMASPFKETTPQEREVLQDMVDEYYQRFLEVVQGHARIPQGEFARATDGRVFSGNEALELGLVDRVGMLEDAIALAQRMGHARGAKVILYKRPFGYSGSIYAQSTTPPPQARAGATIVNLGLPESGLLLERGFYYLWK
jgi:protease-4